MYLKEEGPFELNTVIFGRTFPPKSVSFGWTVLPNSFRLFPGVVIWVPYGSHTVLKNTNKIRILSHALFLKVFKSWVYPSKKKVWCASKIFLKIENMGPKECKNVKILEKNPWHQLSSWGSLSWSQSIKINCNFGVLLIKLTNFRCLLCLNGGSNRPEH